MLAEAVEIGHQQGLAVSPNPNPFSYDRFLQNWPDWDQRGLIEELVVPLSTGFSLL